MFFIVAEKKNCKKNGENRLAIQNNYSVLLYGVLSEDRSLSNASDTFFRNCVNYLKMAETVSAGSHFSLTVVSAGSKRSRRVSTEAKYDGQFLQVAKISRLFYTLCLSTIKMSIKMAISVMYLSFKNDI